MLFFFFFFGGAVVVTYHRLRVRAKGNPESRGGRSLWCRRRRRRKDHNQQCGALHGALLCKVDEGCGGDVVVEWHVRFPQRGWDAEELTSTKKDEVPERDLLLNCYHSEPDLPQVCTSSGSSEQCRLEVSVFLIPNLCLQNDYRANTPALVFYNVIRGLHRAGRVESAILASTKVALAFPVATFVSAIQSSLRRAMIRSNEIST